MDRWFNYFLRSIKFSCENYDWVFRYFCKFYWWSEKCWNYGGKRRNLKRENVRNDDWRIWFISLFI